MKFLVFLLQSLSNRISITTLAAVTLMAVPLALRARPSVDHRGDPLQSTFDFSRHGAQLIAVQEGRSAKPGSALFCARQDTVSIYVFDSHGNAINMTGIDSYQSPIIEDGSGHVVGTVGADDNIYNSSGVIVGYITETAN